MAGASELNGIVGALDGDAVSVRDQFESTDVGSRGKSRIFVANETIKRVSARHSPPPYRFRIIDYLLCVHPG
jgi:hypothetical protein